MADLTNLELLEQLGVETKSKKKAKLTPREERIIAGFEEIQKFVETHVRLPQHGEDRDIFERLYAIRLDQIRQQEECLSLLKELDHQGLLEAPSEIDDTTIEAMENDELLTELGVTSPKEGDVTYLQHVKPRAEIRAAEEIAKRTPCNDFDAFKPIFNKVQKELDSGIRESRPFKDDAEILPGDLFILYGQKAYVDEVGEIFVPDHGRPDSRLRVIYDNGTESDILLRSLQRALNKDPTGRRIIDKSPGPLFDEETGDDDLASGTIYVLRSQSDHPMIKENQEIVHKIGVTGGRIEKRIANAKLDPTFLMADVEIVATYELYNINRAKLEHIFHMFFDEVRLDIQINDRFGHPVIPREWFLVPLFIIDEVVEKIKDGTITHYKYDTQSVSLLRID